MVTGGEHLKVLPEENGDTSLEEILASTRARPPKGRVSPKKTQPRRAGPADRRGKSLGLETIERSEEKRRGFSDGDSRRGSASTPRRTTVFGDDCRHHGPRKRHPQAAADK